MVRLGRKVMLGAVALLTALVPAGAGAGVGDLLVAPTRLILDSGRGGEVILKNIGTETATYRISVEIRRMTEGGSLNTIETPQGRDAEVRDMIMYAPRKVVLPPNQPQSVRISARPPAGFPDGEYRVHMLFRAIPKPTPVEKAADDTVGFRLTPVYGVSIPVIVRLGKVEMKAGLSNVALSQKEGKKGLSVDLDRNGNRSTYGLIRVSPASGGEQIGEIRGVAIYSELNRRSFFMPLDAKQLAAVRAPVKVQYFESSETGEKLMAETVTTVR